MRQALTLAAALACLVSAAAAEDVTGTEKDELLRGTEGVDRIDGLGGYDEIFGFAGDDLLDGGPGNDELFGAEGDDTLSGGTGDDFLDGREGDDTLTGGPGRDVFAYYAESHNGHDTILDFDVAEDRISFSERIDDRARVVVREEPPDTVIELPDGLGTITLVNVTGFDPAEMIVDLGEIIR